VHVAEQLGKSPVYIGYSLCSDSARAELMLQKAVEARKVANSFVGVEALGWAERGVEQFVSLVLAELVQLPELAEE
jgi:hypothetical protein